MATLVRTMYIGPMTAGTMIVGAGTAAGELAIALRQNGYTAPVTMIGTEPHLPYHRPPLSKGFLAGTTGSDALLLRPATAYEKFGIAFQGSMTVVAIDRAARHVALSDGSRLAYDALVLATGGQARRLACPGHDLSGVYALRTLDDVAAIRTNMRPGRRLVLIGGGYVGLEVAAIARRAGLEVTVVEAADRLLARVTGPDISAFYADIHRREGVALRLGAAVTGLLPDQTQPGRVGAVVLKDGERIEADFVIAGIGLVPHTELAAGCGLAVENGILVDEYCRTEDPAVFAIGDCSNHPSRYAARRLRLESVPNALEQARAVAASLTGKPTRYDAIPWFWSDQYDLKLQAVGLVERYDRVVIRGDMASRAFVAFYLRAGVVIAADAVNRPADFLAAKRLVAAGAAPDPDLLRDISVTLKSLIAAA